MNARSQAFEITVEGAQIEEAVASVFHSLLLHRTLGKFHYKAEGSYSVGTIGTEDVDCDFIDLTYVRISSEPLHSSLRREISCFRDSLRQQEGQKHGEIKLEFFEKSRRQWPFGEETVPWEVWNLKVDLLQVTNETEFQKLRESVGEMLSDIVLCICEAVNRQQYLPKMPIQSQLASVFDTRFADVQPYLFRISYQTAGSAGLSMSSTVKKLIKDTLSL